MRYVDYERDWIDEGNTFAPIVHKRKSFEHEREVRAIAARLPGSDENQVIDWNIPSPPGIAVPVNVEDFVDEIRIAPDAPGFRDAVEGVTRKYGVTCEIKKSPLGGEAVF